MTNRRLSGTSPFYGGFYGDEYNKKFWGRRAVKHIANGAGLMIFAYSFLMSALSLGLSFLLKIMCSDNIKFYETYTTAVYFLDIFISTVSVLLPAIVYVKITKQSLSELMPVKRVKANMLIPLVFAGMGVVVLANIASSVVAQNFSIFGIENTASSSGTADRNALEIALNIISVAIVPAFAEEFAFRGVVMGSMRRFGDGAAILFSSVLFAAMHQNISQIPFTFILGLMLAYVDCVTDSIVPSIIIHFANNFYATVMGILSAQGILNDQAYNAAKYGMFILFGAAGIISYIILSKKNNSAFKLKNRCPDFFETEAAQALSFKEKSSAMFTSVGAVLCLVFFTVTTVLNLGLIDVC